MPAQETQENTSQNARGRRRVIVGVVTSNKMQNTVVVSATRWITHARFHKRTSKRVKFMAHDANNECKIGDRVEIEQTRPLSKNKCWRVARLLERAVEA